MINVLLSVKLLSFKGKQADKQTVTHHTNIVADGQLRIKEGEPSRVMWNKKNQPTGPNKEGGIHEHMSILHTPEGRF